MPGRQDLGIDVWFIKINNLTHGDVGSAGQDVKRIPAEEGAAATAASQGIFGKVRTMDHAGFGNLGFACDTGSLRIGNPVRGDGNDRRTASRTELSADYASGTGADYYSICSYPRINEAAVTGVETGILRHTIGCGGFIGQL